VSATGSVAIVDDHLLVAESLRQALLERGVAAVVIAPAAPAIVLDAVRRAQVELVLLDLDLGPHGDSTPVITRLAAAGIRVLTVTGVADELRIAAALEAGAIGYQPKAAGFDALVAQTTVALTAGGPLQPELRARLLGELDGARRLRAQAQEQFRRLTDRESDTLRALGDGLSVRDIADQWVVSEATVRSHVRGVLSKLGTKSQLAAVALAARHGWGVRASAGPL